MEKQDTSRSYWIRSHPVTFDALPTPPLPESCDVVIIGSGITGASVTYHLSQAQPDLKLAVIEARGVCSGATGRNGGHLGRSNAYSVRELSETFGDAETIRLREFMARNRADLVNFVRTAGIQDEVDLRYNGTIVVFKTAEERKEFELDLEWAKSRNMNVEGGVLSPEETLKVVDMNPELAKFGSQLVENCGTIYPRKLVEKLFHMSMDQMSGLTVHPYTSVSAVDYEPGTENTHGYRTTTSRGTVRSRVVFHATNAWSSRLIPEFRKADVGVFPCKSHMMAIQPNIPPPAGQDTTLKQGYGWQESYHWLLQRPNDGPFLHGHAHSEIVGSDFNDNTTLPDENPIRDVILRFLQDAFPKKFKDLTREKDVTHDWTGIQGLTMNGSSIVGRPRLSSPGEFCSVGHNGEGMTRTFLCAKMGVEAMLAQMAGKSWKAPEWFPHSYSRNLNID